ncbi:MAG: hypothetical protein GX221_03805 [Candidatus Riflebacteria bacterium]|nr:hypothetical protein [Candidatus Riflebacteria bacterium]
MIKPRFGKVFLAGILFSLLMLYAMPAAYAQMSEIEDETLKKKLADWTNDRLDREEQLAKEIQSHLNASSNSNYRTQLDMLKDPFKELIQDRPVTRTLPPKTVSVKTMAPKREQVPPLQMTVQGIVGNDQKRLAVVKFEGKEFVISQGQPVEGKFRVVDIFPDRVVVTSIRDSSRSTFRLEKENPNVR